jgi:hypothetical protein
MLRLLFPESLFFVTGIFDLFWAESNQASAN